MNDNNEKLEMRESVKSAIICGVIIAAVLIGISIGFNKGRAAAQRSENNLSSALEQPFPHIDIVDEGVLVEGRVYWYIAVDRETDVEYLITANSGGCGVTVMRDAGGMVLLRE